MKRGATRSTAFARLLHLATVHCDAIDEFLRKAELGKADVLDIPTRTCARLVVDMLSGSAPPPLALPAAVSERLDQAGTPLRAYQARQAAAVNLPLLSGVKPLCNMTERLPVLRAVLCVQRCGVSWLVRHAALGVHGVLCDEMGLGKTLQALTAIAVDRAAEGGRSSAPSLIVCPSTLVAHWHREATRCFGDAQPATGAPPMATTAPLLEAQSLRMRRPFVTPGTSCVRG